MNAEEPSQLRNKLIGDRVGVQNLSSPPPCTRCSECFVNVCYATCNSFCIVLFQRFFVSQPRRAMRGHRASSRSSINRCVVAEMQNADCVASACHNTRPEGREGERGWTPDRESTADLQTIVSINGDNGAVHRPMRRK